MTGIEPYILALTLSAEAAVGSGSFTPYYLVSNRHGVMDERANTGYTRAKLEWQQQRGEWQLEAALDVTASVHAYHSVFLQQCYASAAWRWLAFGAGCKEEQPLLRDQRLSSGQTVWSGNCRPIPQVKAGLNGFQNIPYLKGWVQILLEGSYGYFLDSDYLKEEYALYAADKTGYGRSWITTDVWYHQKKGYLRSRPDLPLVVTAGIEHAVQFGGHTRNYIDPALTDVNLAPKAIDFLRVLMPRSGGDNAAGGDQSFVYGNHLGNINVLVEYRFGAEREHRIGAYLEDPFEDGSGMRKGNGYDGLWGIEYHCANPDAWVTGVVAEYLQTTDQSGPIHWSPHDFAGQDIVMMMPGDATGADDYYNNYLYNGYSHFGMACGSPMLKSPAFNADHYLRFTDTRVKALHLGIEGCLKPQQLYYRVLASQRRSWGTFYCPAPDIVRGTSAMAELTYRQGKAWEVTASYAFDQGQMMGDNHALGLRFTYHVF